jgi:hypothetical protein
MRKSVPAEYSLDLILHWHVSDFCMFINSEKFFQPNLWIIHIKSVGTDTHDGASEWTEVQYYKSLAIVTCFHVIGTGVHALSLEYRVHVKVAFV